MNAPLPPEELRQFHTWEEIARDTKLWVSLLWAAILKRARGYRFQSQRHTGKVNFIDGTLDRRKDKLEGETAAYPNWLRSYRRRYESPVIKPSRRAQSRARARMMGAR